jgi:serine acetyltransferase
VTLGAKSFPVGENGTPVKGVLRHPIVEDDVVIYAGATGLGRVTIGRWSTIGRNVWITRHIRAGSIITQAQVRSDVLVIRVQRESHTHGRLMIGGLDSLSSTRSPTPLLLRAPDIFLD